MSQALRRASPSKPTKGLVRDLQEQLQASDQEMSLLLRATPRTLHRWASAPPEDYAPLLQLQALMELALKSLRKEAVGEWIHERNRALGGSIPIIQAADPRGYELVYNLLWDAYHGLPL
jgi:hypothetical protein